MPQEKQRKAARKAPALEVVTVYRAREGLSYSQAVQELRERADLYAVFCVVAVVRDASAAGLGISFEGQQLMSKNILRPGGQYLLKLVLPGARFPKAIAPFLVSEGSYSFLLIRAACRWYRQSDNLSTAGFEILESNPEEVRTFILTRFQAARAPE